MITAAPKVILLVDDDADDRELFNEAIVTIDPEIEAHYCENGQAALDKLGGLTHLPQVIFLDVNMPVMDGWSFLTRIKSDERVKHIHVIMYSTPAFKRDIMKAKELGASWFFMKPNGYEDLKRVLFMIVDNIHNDLEGLKNSASRKEVEPFLTFINGMYR